MTVTDAMVEAGARRLCNLHWGDEDDPSSIQIAGDGTQQWVEWEGWSREILGAALAVQTVPTDAEIERAIDRLELATIEWGSLRVGVPM